MNRGPQLFLTCLTIFLSSMPLIAWGQFGNSGAIQQAAPVPDPAAKQATPVIIADEPRAIDPASLLPESLSAKATVKFENTSISDVVQWLQQEGKLNVYLDVTTLRDDGLLISEPVTDRLDDEPVYQLLDRLESMGLGWYLDKEIVVITGLAMVQDTLHTVSYNLGEFFAQGYDHQQLVEVIEAANDGDWEDIDGVGGAIVLLGDVAFIRNTANVHREIQGLLAALRTPARRTLVLDPPQHAVLREKLKQPVAVEFRNVPLVDALRQLSQLGDMEIRLDFDALKDEGIRDRTPVSLQLGEQPLSVTLEFLLDSLDLTWQLRDGRLGITTRMLSEDLMSTAVFDVRDLCRDEAESAALAHALQWQTNADWEDVDGVGGRLLFPLPGIMVVRQNAVTQDAILTLLESYRTALKLSKPRPVDDSRMKEVLTRYYRLPTPMALALTTQLSQLVPLENWKTDELPDGIGTIQLLPTTPGLLNAQGREIVGAADPKSVEQALVVDYSVLVIRQTRQGHIDIANVVDRMQSGDPREFPEGSMPGMGGGGMGGFGGGFGGFGGGFPSIPAESGPSQERK